MHGLGIKLDNMIINSYSLSSPLSFNLGTSPTQVLAYSGTGDEALEIRPLQFFEYDASNWGLLYLAKASASEATRSVKLATAAKSGFNHTWTKQGSVLTSGGGAAWDEQIGSATVVKNGSTWILLYESFDGGVVGAATGTNLLSLTKHASNPLIDNTASSDFNKYLRHPSAIIKDTDLYCIYEGRPDAPEQSSQSKIGYATAPLSDITDWTVSSTQLIDPTQINFSKGNYSTVINPMVQQIGDYYYMWFWAFITDGPSNPFNEYSFGGTTYAYSSDLINWNVVGTNNYHVYQGLFGYNTSNQFYQNFQEVTPVYDGTDLSLYFWTKTSTNIGKLSMDGAVFSNVFRGFDLQDSFDDDSIDSGIWTNNGGTGITISETGGDLVISKNGTQVQATTTVFESIESWNNDDGVIVCAFTIDITDHNSTDFWAFELSDAAGLNTDAIRIARSTTTDECNFVVRGNNNTVASTAITSFTGRETFKIVIAKRDNIRIYRSGGTKGFDTIYNQELTGANEIENTDWTFKILVENSVSSANTIRLENVAIGEYDRGLVGGFDNTSVLEVIGIDKNAIVGLSETTDFLIEGAGFNGCAVSVSGNATLNDYEIVSNTHISANITTSASNGDIITFTVDNGSGTDTVNITAYDIPTANITHYYPLTENSNDSVGALDGSDTSITYTTVGGKSAASFGGTGSGSVIDFGDDNDFSFGDGSVDSAYTLFFEIYLNNLPSSVAYPVSKREGTTLREYGFTINTSGDVGAIVFDQSAASYLYGVKSAAFSTGSWYRVFMKYNPSAGDYTDLVIKINEVVQTTSDSSSGTYTAMENLTAPLRIGKRWDTVSIDGGMRNLTIINKFTTDSEDTGIATAVSNDIPLI